MNRLSEREYEKSQSQAFPAGKIKAKTKKKYRELMERERLTQEDLQDYADLLCGDLAIPMVKVSYAGREPYAHDGQRLKRKTHGTYQRRRGDAEATPLVRIYRLTAVRGQERAVKSVVQTLLHELCHHIDIKYFKMAASPHTSGFFNRIMQIAEAQRWKEK